MVQSNDSGNGNGNGQKEYNPEVEFEYLDADVWIKTDAEGNKDVAYTQDVMEALEDDEESDANGSSNDG
ncbi:hypothetical protein H6F47_09265 [Sphaerospermopsis sp. FACHB-1094]|jgi:hypothetical protein|uniref:hypothetical protein n=1 Tax=Sphaerospermopsis sp. FACHB-1094 TaxID=2692861 RepID=UPI001689F1C2|nr:hypothetical protein [Sphaerospermopsis sp. FACHB-1094]MBD2132609.1 hypothetical protein [Sphaerospermopsis sp. FACHB-1094]